MAKPAEKPTWATDVSAAVLTPPSGDKLTGWTGAKPFYQWFNWLAKWTSLWIDYFETTTDTNTAGLAAELVARAAADSTEATTRATAITGVQTRIGLIYKAIVGSSAQCTHATLAAALADSVNVPAGSCILLTENQALTSTVIVGTANILIEAAPGVTFSNSGAGTGIQINATGCRIRGLRMTGFTTAIQIANGILRNFITECSFGTCTTDVNDLNTTANSVIANNISE